MTKRLQLNIEGLVQGVGFRPFVYVKALEFGLVGFVLNDTAGVEVQIQGEQKNLDAFLYELQNSLPPLARIDKIEKTYIPLKSDEKFIIKKSQNEVEKFSPVLPDMALCDECLQEMRDKNNRRYKYPFINCTNCGPRYSIIKNIPYDRPYTTMAKFKMCEKCQAEYENPLDRRYHAQPISCHECGVRLAYISKDEKLLGDEGIEKIAKLINDGKIVAVKGVGGFHLICDASNPEPVKRLREFKSRPVKPFALMCESLAQARQHVSINNDEKKALESIEKPIVLMRKKPSSNICNEVAPQTDRLGIFLPNTPLHILLFDFLKAPIIATSANIKGEPIITSIEQMSEKFGDLLDAVLDYDRDIAHPCDDSVLQIVEGKNVYLRISRALTPLNIPLSYKSDQNILCVGAEQKNAFAFYFHGRLILSPYIGDMDKVKTYELFVKTVENFKRFYGIKFDEIVHDKHPNYATTKWSKEQGVKSLSVQHHHAHILSVLLDRKMPLNTKVLGVAWDGTGYGDDGTIWGGEFLVCEGREYERVAHFKPFKLLGGDKSIKNINRIAYSMFLDAGVELEEFEELKPLKQMYEKNINSPLCSSVGRLFDAVCYLATGLKKVSYDGQSGLLLESLYDESIEETYEYEFQGKAINYDKMLLQMLDERDKPNLIASKFLNTLCEIIIDISNRYKLPLVVGGGVFQNKTLLELLFKKSSKKVHFPQKFSPNDGGVCVGQLGFALAQFSS